MSALDDLLAYVSDEHTLEAGEELLRALPGYTEGYDLLWFAMESEECSEEYAWMGLLHKDNQLFMVNGGHFYEADNRPDAFAPQPVTAEDALADIRWNVENTPK